MKGIIIKDCLECPHSKIKNPNDNGGTIFCEIKEKDVHKMINLDYPIPDWCPITDLQNILDIADYRYQMVQSRFKKTQEALLENL